MEGTKGSQIARWSKPQKADPSSDCSLQLENMKLELLVIADQNAAVNAFPGLVHTARHTMGVVIPEACELTLRVQQSKVG
jgi:hypothetical protein